MRITPDEIEAGLLAKLRQQPRFGALLSAADTNTTLEVPPGVADKLARAATAVAGMLTAQVALLLLGRALARANAALAIAFLLFALFVPTIGAVIWFQTGLDRPRRVVAPTAAARGLSVDEWRRALALLPAAELSPAEESYGEAVATLLEAAGAGRMGEAEARSLLDDLNALLGGDRALAAREDDLARLTEFADPVRLGAERDDLRARRDAAVDLAARAALEESLAMVEVRLAQAADVPPLLERVQAQREATAQGLTSLAASLLRLKAGPDVADTLGAGESARRAGETARAMVRQTRAVEEAAAEVTTLRTGAGR